MEGQYRKVIVNQDMAGGKGTVTVRHILNEEEMDIACRLYAEVTVAPGASIGVHSHHGETETYYILQGEGLYTDNGKESSVKAGAITFCKDGDSHGLSNTGTGDLVFMALILSKQ